MKKYLVTKFFNFGEQLFICVLKVEKVQSNSDLNIINEYDDYKISKVVIDGSAGKLSFMDLDDGYIGWKFSVDNDNHTKYKKSFSRCEEDILLEFPDDMFPDDESELLWFKLECGG